MKIPILKLKDILLTSIQVDLTDQEAMEFQNGVLQKVTETEARGMVIDITALDVVDSYMAKVLNDTATMVRLLGAEVVISGMQPSVALTLIEMGRELIGVQTALNLELGLEKVQQLVTAKRDASSDENSPEDGHE
ncbi:MAG: STAS domain-containing protein [bacterium]